MRCRSEPLAQIVRYYKQQGVYFESRAKLFEQVIVDFAALVSKNFNIPEFSFEDAMAEIEQFKFVTLKTGITAIANVEMEREEIDSDLLSKVSAILANKQKPKKKEGDLDNE